MCARERKSVYVRERERGIKRERKIGVGEYLSKPVRFAPSSLHGEKQTYHVQKRQLTWHTNTTTTTYSKATFLDGS